MNYFNDILDEFKDGTAEERLDLYLHNRNLRSELDQIEDEENASVNTEITVAPQLVIKPRRTYEQQSLLGRMKHWCLSVIS
jgi:hypothetical protein